MALCSSGSDEAVAEAADADAEAEAEVEAAAASRGGEVLPIACALSRQLSSLTDSLRGGAEHSLEANALGISAGEGLAQRLLATAREVVLESPQPAPTSGSSDGGWAGDEEDQFHTSF